MPEAAIRVVDVYPYRLAKDGLEFLLLRRAEATTYAGEWRMVGGTIRPGEAAWETALRELREETQCTPEHVWTLPSLTRTSHERRREAQEAVQDAICAPQAMPRIVEEQK